MAGAASESRGAPTRFRAALPSALGPSRLSCTGVRGPVEALLNQAVVRSASPKAGRLTEGVVSGGILSRACERLREIGLGASPIRVLSAWREHLTLVHRQCHVPQGGASPRVSLVSSTIGRCVPAAHEQNKPPSRVADRSRRTRRRQQRHCRAPIHHQVGAQEDGGVSDLEVNRCWWPTPSALYSARGPFLVRLCGSRAVISGPTALSHRAR